MLGPGIMLIKKPLMGMMGGSLGCIAGCAKTEFSIYLVSVYVYDYTHVEHRSISHSSDIQTEVYIPLYTFLYIAAWNTFTAFYVD